MLVEFALFDQDTFLERSAIRATTEAQCAHLDLLHVAHQLRGDAAKIVLSSFAPAIGLKTVNLHKWARSSVRTLGVTLAVDTFAFRCSLDPNPLFKRIAVLIPESGRRSKVALGSKSTHWRPNAIGNISDRPTSAGRLPRNDASKLPFVSLAVCYVHGPISLRCVAAYAIWNAGSHDPTKLKQSRSTHSFSPQCQEDA